jgi:phosphoglycerate dehydrogenase-like enzyme
VALPATPAFRILVSSPMFGRYSKSAVSRLEQEGCAVRPAPAAIEPHELIAEVRDVDAWIVGLQPVTEPVIGPSRRLRVVAVHGVGYDNVDVATATRLGIAVVNTPGSNATGVAELTLGLIIGLARDIVRADQIVRSGGWQPTMVGEEIGGKTLGIVGFGPIGQKVSAFARGLGMGVLVYSRSAPGRRWTAEDPVEPRPVPASPGVGEGADVQFVALDELLRRSDYVTIHTALREETRGLIGERELGIMKSTACLVNTARGAILDEEALYRALVAGRIRGAALDVFATEPPVDRRLTALPQVICASHLGGNTAESFRRSTDAVTDSLLSALKGVQPPGLVNPEVWPAYQRRWQE